MSKKYLPEFENESLVTIVRIRAELLISDGVSLDQESDDLPKEVHDNHARYGSAGLQAYREYMAMKNPVTGLREMVMISMAEVDGYVDYGSAIIDKPHLRSLYAKYSGAIVKAIITCLIEPARIVVEEESDEEKNKKEKSDKSKP